MYWMMSGESKKVQVKDFQFTQSISTFCNAEKPEPPKLKGSWKFKYRYWLVNSKDPNKINKKSTILKPYKITINTDCKYLYSYGMKPMKLSLFQKFLLYFLEWK